MPTLEDYTRPCRICSGYNPSTCDQCKRYKIKLMDQSINGFSFYLKLKFVDKYWDERRELLKKASENDGLFTWEDYEHN